MDPITKWTCSPTVVKNPSLIKRLHVYDFDNTLFKSPWTNKSLYTYPTLQMLLDNTCFLTGGWWDDPIPFELILKLSGADTSTNATTTTTNNNNSNNIAANKCKSTLTNYWNHDMLKLSKLSNEQKDTISIILTGRKNNIFKDLILKIIELSKLEDPLFLKPSLQFDAICLKKSIKDSPGTTTMMYKIAVLRDFLEYYPNLEEITIYDDRMNQVNGFNRFFNDIKVTFPKLQWFIIPVEPKFTRFPQYIEFLYFQTVLQRHNKILRSLPDKGQYYYYKLQWTKFTYGYFLKLESYQFLIKRIEKNLTDRLIGKTNDKSDYSIDIVNLFDYPCYIPCQLPKGKYLSNEILYRIITHNKSPNVPQKIMNSVVSNYLQVSTDPYTDHSDNHRNRNSYYSNKNSNYYHEQHQYGDNDMCINAQPELCKYDFLLKAFGVKLINVDNDNKIIKIEIIIKFQPTEEDMDCCYSLYDQFILLSHNNDVKRHQHTTTNRRPSNATQTNGTILDKVYWESCIEDPLIVETTFGVFSKMKCIRI